MDSDTDPELVPIPPALWKQFEKETAVLLSKLDPDAIVQHDVHQAGLVSGADRQVDVLITGTLGGEEISIAVECKRYARPLGIGTVDEFVGKLLDLGVDRGVLFALNGLTGPATKRAAGALNPKVSIGRLDRIPALPVAEVDHLFTGFGDCPNTNCYTGDVHWRDWEDSDRVIRAGSCYVCGTWAATCPECGEIVMFVSDSETCWCGQEINILWDRDGAEVDEVTAPSP